MSAAIGTPAEVLERVAAKHAREKAELDALVSKGLPDMVTLIPVSDPLAASSGALREAAWHGHTECIELLKPVSDPAVVAELAPLSGGSSQSANEYTETTAMICESCRFEAFAI